MPYWWGQGQSACLSDSSPRDYDYTPDMDDLREKRATLAHGSEGQGSVYVWWGGTVVEADHGRGLWCGFVHSLPDQENRGRPRSRLLQ